MIYKKRNVSHNYAVLKMLTERGIFTGEDYEQLNRQLKGLEGERDFDQWTEKLPEDFLVLNDLYLRPLYEVSQQIDSVIIYGDCLYLYEIKNYSGRYIYSDQLLTSCVGRYQIPNPVLQLRQKEQTLWAVLENLDLRMRIESYVVFINPHFFLYELPMSPPIIFLGMIEEHLKKMSTQQGREKNWRQRNIYLAEHLASVHQDDLFYENFIPEVEMSELRRGLHCPNCFSLDLHILHKSVICEKCEKSYDKIQVVEKNISVLSYAFYREKLTVHTLQELLDYQVSRATVYKALSGRRRNNKFYHKG